MSGLMKIDDFTLSGKELAKIAGLSLLLPLPINWVLVKLNPLMLIDGAGDVATWINYGGGYIGGIIGGIISILILNRTLQQTGVLHRDLKVLQLNTILYTRQQEWLKGFREQLADNLKSIDLYALNTVVSCLSLKDYAYAKELLAGINKQLEYQVVMSSFCFPSSQLSEEEKTYLDTNRQMQLEYGSLIKDLLYYIPLAESMCNGHMLSYEEVIDYTMTQYDYLQEQDASQYTMARNLCSQVLEISPEADVHQELQRMTDIRLTMRTNLYQLKARLAEATHKLIDYEEDKIRKILTADS